MGEQVENVYLLMAVIVAQRVRLWSVKTKLWLAEKYNRLKKVWIPKNSQG